MWRTKQILDIKQMQHLRSLGIDDRHATFCRVITEKGIAKTMWHCLKCYNVKYRMIIPTFTLQDILDLLPKEIIDKDGYCNILNIGTFNNDWYLCYELSNEFEPLIAFENESIIDAAYDLLCWCVENGYIKTNKEIGE